MSEYDSWAPVYDAWFPGTEDVPHYTRLAEEAAGPIVELAVGTGRVAIPIARETGRRVIGIDSSQAMLEIGRERAGDLPVEFHEGDFRDFTVEEPVELVICPARALLHAPTWADKRRVFESVARALKPGGRFAFNVFVFSHTIAARLDGQTQDQNGVVHTITYAPADNRVDITRDDGATIHLWWATKSEWEGLIDVAGLEVEALYGGFEQEPYTDESLEMVWVTRKPA